MTGKHIRRKKHILRFVIGILVVGLGIFCYFHFCDDQEIDLSQYETMVVLRPSDFVTIKFSENVTMIFLF